MIWEMLAIWAIVIVTVTWFFRDEKRLASEAALAWSAAYYAFAPQYRYSAPTAPEQPGPTPAPRTGGLSEAQRSYLKSLSF